MDKTMFTREELIARAGIDERELIRLEKNKLVAPVGTTSDGMPLYAPAVLERLKGIQTLTDLGYKPEDVHKIIKKVGFPGSAEKGRRSEREGEFLTVGGLAERVGISPRTIKHWEDKGIIEPDMRSEGGFRLYSKLFVYICELIRDLQLFGYSLEEIKSISVLFRDFLTIKDDAKAYSGQDTARKIEEMRERIRILYMKMEQLKTGIERWDDLLKKKKREISALANRNRKRLAGQKRGTDE